MVLGQVREMKKEVIGNDINFLSIGVDNIYLTIYKPIKYTSL